MAEKQDWAERERGAGDGEGRGGQGETARAAGSLQGDSTANSEQKGSLTTAFLKSFWC